MKLMSKIHHWVKQEKYIESSMTLWTSSSFIYTIHNLWVKIAFIDVGTISQKIQQKVIPINWALHNVNESKTHYDQFPSSKVAWGLRVG